MPAECLNLRYWIIQKNGMCKLGFICAFYIILHKCIIVTASQTPDGPRNSPPFSLYLIIFSGCGFTSDSKYGWQNCLCWWWDQISGWSVSCIGLKNTQLWCVQSWLGPSCEDKNDTAPRLTVSRHGHKAPQAPTVSMEEETWEECKTRHDRGSLMRGHRAH